MQFLAPWMLLGTLAVAIPLALHLIQRSRPKVVPWAAMEFLLKSIKQTQAASRLRDLILLLCRMAVIALVALALARPSASFVQVSGPVDAVILLDLSQSMKTLETREGNRVSRFEIAREKTSELLSRLPTGSRVRLLPFTTRCFPLPLDATPRDPWAARDSLASLKPTDAGTDLHGALKDAFAILEAGTLPHKQIHLISDASESVWRFCGPRLVTHRHSGTDLHWLRVGTPVEAQAQILESAPVGGLVLSGRRQAWKVRVRNTGHQPIKDLTLTLSAPLSRSLAGQKDPDQRETVAIADLGPGEERIVHPELLLDRPGWQAVEAVVTFPGNRLEAASRFCRMVQARESFRALLVEEPSRVDPTRGNSLFLATALRSLAGDARADAALPGDSSEKIRVETKSASSVGPGILTGIDLVLLCGADPARLDAGFVRELGDWCAQGRVVYLMAPTQSEEQPKPADGRTPFLQAMPKLLDRAQAATADLRVDPASATAWLAPFSQPPLDRIGRARWFRFQPIGPPAETMTPAGWGNHFAETLLRASDGKPVAIATEYERGRIVATNLAFDTGDGDFPLGPIFVPWTGALVAHAEDWLASPRNLGAGMVIFPTSAQAKSDESETVWKLRGPEDQSIDWNPSQPSQPVYMNTAGIWSQPSQPVYMNTAGIWRAEKGEVPVPGALWAVTGDPTEAADLDPAAIPFAIESTGGWLKVTDLAAGGATQGSLGLEGGELTPWLVWIGLATLLVEGAVAWWAGRPL